jgi:xylose isomerase
LWGFNNKDIAPGGSTLAASNRNLDKLVAHAKGLQRATGVRLLWGTANLFSNPRYMCGAATNPDAHVFAYAAAQVKKALEVTLELGGQNYVFWGGREGYETLLNTNLKREQEHRFQGPVPDRAQAQGADEAPVRLRRRERDRLSADLRPREAFQVQHRDQPRDPRGAHVQP